jgi:hypothetical protein
LIPVRPRWGPSGGGRHRRRHHATGSSTGFISRVSPSWLMTEAPLPTPAEPAVVAHDTKNSKGRESIVRIVRRRTNAHPPEAPAGDRGVPLPPYELFERAYGLNLMASIYFEAPLRTTTQ